MKLLNLSNWLTSLVESFTFYGGGGSGGGTSTTTTGIDPAIKPYVTDILSKGQELYNSNNPKYYEGQTYVSPSEQTTRALSTAERIATGGNPLLDASLQQQQDVVSGKYLQNNPYFEQALAGAAQGATTNYMDAIKAAQGNASMSGRYGSGVSSDIQNRAANTLSQTLANKYGDLAYSNYANERGMQNAAATNSPALSAARYQDANQLMNIGKINEDYKNQALQADISRFNFGQNLPYQKLQNYANLINQAPAGTVSTTQSQQSGGKIVCTAMNAEYGFGSFRNAIWLAQSKDLDPAYEKGYHALFLPLVTYAYKSGTKSALQRTLRGVLEHIARHRTADIWKQKRGKNRDNIGMIYRAILEPICYIVGKVGK